MHPLVCQCCKAPYLKKQFEHKPEPVVEIEGATIIWDFAIDTARKTEANKPSITITDHQNNSYLLVKLMFPISKNL